LPSDPPPRRVDDRRVFSAIVYVLRIGCQWNALPKELCSSSTAHRRFQEWEAGGLFQRAGSLSTSLNCAPRHPRRPRTAYPSIR
jgi:hypothetical protein